MKLYASPQSVVEDITPEPGVDALHTGVLRACDRSVRSISTPVNEGIALATVPYVAPAPAGEYIAPAASCAAETPVVEYLSPAVTYTAPSPWQPGLHDTCLLSVASTSLRSPTCFERCGSGPELHVSLLSPGLFDEEQWYKDAVLDILRRFVPTCGCPSLDFRREGSVLF